MKAVIVEIRGNTVVMLSEDGCIVKARNKNYEIGQEVEIKMKNKLKIKKPAIIAAIAACFMLMFSGGAYAYYTPSAYVSLDVNPSIEYSINTFDKVLSVTGVNDDGLEIIDELELKNLENKSIDDAISLTVEQIAALNYLDGDEAGIMITTSSDNLEKAEELAADLETVVNEVCKTNDYVAVVTAEAVGAERVAQARELGVTPGKLNLVEKLMASATDSSSIDMNEWLNKPVKDIMAQTNQNKKQAKEEEKNKEQAKNAGVTQNQEQNQNEEINANSDALSVQSNEIGNGNSGNNGQSTQTNNGNSNNTVEPDKTNNGNSGSNGKKN